MTEKGIETGTHYKPIHTMKMYHTKTDLSVTDNAGKNIVTIPIHPNLENHDVKKIIRCINDASN